MFLEITKFQTLIWKSSTTPTKESFQSRIILGIDPGIANTGYALLQEKGGALSLLDNGVYITKKGPVPARIKQIYDFLQGKIKEFDLSAISIEKIFFNKNVKTAMIIEEVRGAILLLSAQHQIPIYQYTPLQVKKCLTLFGKASKLEVKMIAEQILGAPLPKSDDACDAVAVALCYSLMGGQEENDDFFDTRAD
jgi:crossover junction endodeoxyribonuclease RuvC